MTGRHFAWLSALAAGVAAIGANVAVGDEPASLRLLLVLPFVIATGAALLRHSIGFATRSFCSSGGR